tara:strand:+ start:192 stop:383 length:192 start_codon:yes stop_codon:yes gene_type:complete
MLPKSQFQLTQERLNKISNSGFIEATSEVFIKWSNKPYMPSNLIFSLYLIAELENMYLIGTTY